MAGSIWDMVVEFFAFFGDLFSRRSYRGNPPEARRMVLLIIVGTLPLFLVLPIKDKVEAFGGNPLFVCGALLITGCILFLSDQMARGRKTARNATLLDYQLDGKITHHSGNCHAQQIFGQAFRRNAPLRLYHVQHLHAKPPGTPPCWMSCWWARPRPAPLSQGCPGQDAPSPPGWQGDLTGTDHRKRRRTPPPYPRCPASRQRTPPAAY